MILYFTGTGNSCYGAEAIGAALGEAAVSINKYMQKGEYPEFHSDSPYVIVVPAYAWRIPLVVEDFLRRCTFTGCRDAFFVMTCGDSIGNAGAYAKKLCEEKGLFYRGIADVVMPENFITMFKAPSAEEEVLIMEKARRRLKSVAEKILRDEDLTQKSPAAKLLSGVVNPVFYRFFVKDGPFRSLEHCNGCGKCSRLCPLNNIRIEEGHPVWKGNCTQCMACICGCPEEAIEYGKKSVGKRRYWCRTFE